MTILARNGVFQLVKKVPTRFRAVETRRQIWISLHTDSRATAERKAAEVWALQVSAWEAKLDGDTTDAERRYEAARRLAQASGFRFLNVDAVARLPLEEILDRADRVRAEPKSDRRLMAEAVLGGATKPAFTVSKALDAYWEIADDKTNGKSDDQIRRWRNPRVKAFRNFIEVVGDLPLSEITAEDMLRFRDWWWQRIKREGMTVNSGNKDFTHLTAVLRLVNARKHLGLTMPLDHMTIEGQAKKTRPPLEAEWIKERILAPGALNGLNREARCILVGMVNTGYRPSEGAGLTAARIRLDVNLPHIEIAAEGRTLKTSHSARIIPLAGVSLEAFRECPEGFPRYADKPGLSATVNKYLRANRLLPEDGEHSMYSLRHSFEDRLLHADVDERIRRDLMGHALNRERYGKGASLEKLHEVVSRIAI